MHMNRLMLIGVEVEDKSEIFVYFRHIIVIISRCKDTIIFLNTAQKYLIFRKYGSNFCILVSKLPFLSRIALLWEVHSVR